MASSRSCDARPRHIRIKQQTDLLYSKQRFVVYITTIKAKPITVAQIDDEDNKEASLFLELEELEPLEDDEELPVAPEDPAVVLLETLEYRLESSTLFPPATQAHWVSASKPFPSGSTTPLMYFKAPFGVSGISLLASQLLDLGGQLE